MQTETNIAFPLPPAFLQQMKQLLGDHYEAFMASYDQQPYRGIRFRYSDCPLSSDDIEGRIPYAKNAFFLSRDSLAGAQPLHEAGAYYIQEPSAMTAAAVLAPQDGDRVLDLCAAPGGKSTQLAMSAQLELLIANEPMSNRAQILSRNIERMGIDRCVVTSAYPAALAKKWPAFFDKILVDAPCSGEGMFRKHPEARAEWHETSPENCAERQLEILSCAAKMLRSGGRMVYSTCTFNSLENEGVIKSFLLQHPEFHLLPFSLPSLPAASEGMLHIWPHEVRGEGHFVALLEKDDGQDEDRPKSRGSQFLIDKKLKSAAVSFFADMLAETDCVPNAEFGGKAVVLPDTCPDLSGIKVLRAGLHLGELRGKTFIPDHAAALAVPMRKCFDMDDEQVKSYLHGDVIPCAETLKGYVVMRYQGYALGFAKASDGMLKNHYPKGLRK